MERVSKECQLTLLNAILGGTLVVLVLLLPGHTLNALIVVVLVGGALGGVGALCLNTRLASIQATVTA